MKKDYLETADTLIAAMGGKDNIIRLFHCMTRLRFYVKDKTKSMKGDFKALRSFRCKLARGTVSGYCRK